MVLCVEIKTVEFNSPPKCSVSDQRCHFETNMARAKALKTILLEKISRERQRRRQLRRNMVTLVLMRKKFIVRLCLLTCLLLQSSEDEISARRPRSCRRSHKNTGWWELVWASYDEGRFKETFRVSKNKFNLILKSI